MKPLIRRLTQLERRLVPKVDQRHWEAAKLLGERRRRRLEAEGKPFIEPPYIPPRPSGRRMSFSETLRYCHVQRIAALQQGESQP